MDIRLKNIRFSQALKVISLILCFISLYAFFFITTLSYQYGIDAEFKSSTSYFNAANTMAFSIINDYVINKDTNSRKAALLKMKELRNIKYYIVENGKVVTNIDNSPNPQTVRENCVKAPYCMIADGNNGTVWVNEDHWLDYDIDEWIYGTENKLYIYTKTGDLIKGDGLYTAQQRYRINQSLLNKAPYILLLSIVLFLASLVYLIYSAGRKNSDNQIHLGLFDRIYLEFKIIIVIMCLLISIVILQTQYYSWDTPGYLIILLMTVLMILYIPGINLILHITKRIKNHSMIKNSLICLFLIFLKRVFVSKPLRIKAVLLLLLYAALNIILFTGATRTAEFGCIAYLSLFLALNVSAIIFIGKQSIAFGDILRGTDKVASGDLTYRLEEKGCNELTLLARSINNIGKGLQTSVSEAIKSERLKTELITNVSHDLKTPLTSIINYIELLKKEEANDIIKDYVQVLDQKSQKLKLLVEDLFEAAKAASGSIPVSLGQVDPEALIRQAIAEYDEKLKTAALELKTSFPDEKTHIKADGRLLWRVIDNLLSNIIKYSLKGSRVYLEVISREIHVEMIIKNISANELNFSAEEIVERFKRGDESRHTEGSGLGLAIAKSLIELQKGSFKIEIDGDLFKIIIQLPKI